MQQNQQNKHSQPIRNIKGFLKAYLNSESGRRSLTRQPKLVEKSAKDSRGNVIHWKEPQGSNHLAIALAEAAYEQVV